MAKVWIKNSTKIKFTDEEKLQCMSSLFRILYHKNFDLMKDYGLKEKEFHAQAKKTIKENPGVHFNWIFPSPENYLKDCELKFGNY